MARSKEIAGKVERLEMALKRAEAEFTDDHIFEKQAEMTGLIGCSWPTLRDWIDQNPAIERPEFMTRGGNGVRWQFIVRPFLGALLEIFRKEAESKTAANAELRRKIGVDLPVEEHSATLGETKELINMTMTVMGAKREQKAYTLTAKTADLFSRHYRRTVDGLMGINTRIDPNGKLPAAVKALLDEEIRSLAAQIATDAEADLRKYLEGSEQERIGD
jgi:hypothetical protein